MKPLYSQEGELALGRLASSRALFAFDFDGTLAPIVVRPDQARATTDVFERLARLARLASVAVISGRRLSDLRSRIPPEVRVCVGNHGSERSDAVLDSGPMRDICRAWVGQLRARLDADGSDSGIFVEDKDLTLSVHYRVAPDRKRAARLISDWISELEPEPRVIGGKFVFNLLPAQARDKHEALAEIALDTQADAVLFVGDDVTDELVFSNAPPEWITVRVEHAPDSHARFFISDQAKVAGLLDHLIEMRMRQERSQRGESDRD